jgi:hypothetical protein
MLEIAKVIRRSAEGRFDTVYFFDMTHDLVDSTTKRIPGAIGFPGEFASVVLADDPGEGDPDKVLEPPSNEEDTVETRKRQLLLHTHRNFIRSFPFDVMNLDLEGFFFRAMDPLPGRFVNAMRKVFTWQRNPLRGPKGEPKETLDGFSLMFTTQIGPSNLAQDYLEMLRGYLKGNIDGHPALSDQLETRTGYRDLGTLEAEHFEIFFKLAAPKLMASILDEQDWYVDSSEGIRIYEFERSWKDGVYKMLHLVMHVGRKHPPSQNRAPGQQTQDARDAYIAVVEKLFAEEAVKISETVINQVELQASLDEIKARRRKIYPEGD